MISDTFWFAVAWSAAINGVFHPGTTPLPVLPSANFLSLIVGAPLLLFSKQIGQMRDEMPASWLVAHPLRDLFDPELMVPHMTRSSRFASSA